LDAFDIVLLPHYILDEIPLLEIDLAINTVSFQEMTSAQVRRYAERLHEIGCRALYSLNRDRSGHNDELDAVSQILAEQFALTEIEVLEVPYTSLSVKPKAPKRAKEAARGVARVANEVRSRRSRGGEPRGMTAAVSVWERPATSYRHLVGRPR
jgi:hypothetical protein